MLKRERYKDITAEGLFIALPTKLEMRKFP
jgi:hypothetical protein